MLAKLWIFSLFCLTYGSCANLTKSFLEVNGTIIGNRTFNPADGPYLVTSELVVAHNATLTIEAGSEVLFVPNVGVRVHGSLHARGTPSNRIKFRALPCNETALCNNTNLDRFYNPGIRLVGGTSHSNGRLEIQWNGQWGTICNTYWDYSDTTVACRQLGFVRAKRYYRHPGSGPVYMKDVHCNGKEESLWDCGYNWRSCYHYYDVGIECDSLMALLSATVYWKGIYFAPRNFTEKQGNSFLQNADIMYAFEGIKAVKKVPDLLNVTIRDGASGLLVKELKNHLAIVGTTVLRSLFDGVNIESSGGDLVIENTTVQNATFGDGLVYNRILDAADFCSIVPDKASLPFVLKATGRAWTVNCSKVFRAGPGRTLSVHFRSIAGSEFELNVTDGSAYNNTLLFITDEYNGKTLKTASRSVLELSFYSKGNSKVPANLEMIILQDQGWPPSLLISNSTFSNNFKSGIEVYDVIGYSQISNTLASKNGGVGLHISRAQGRLHVLSSVLVDNQNHGVHIESMSGSVVLETVSASKNQESGIVIESGTFSLLMTDSRVNENLVQGLYISSPLDSTMNISNTKFLRNSGGQGMYFKNFLEDCQILLSGITSLGNSHNGALFERVKAKSLNVTTSSFDGNTLHGLYVEQVLTVSVKFQEISTSNNLKTGVFVYQGSANMNIESWTSIGNQVDGFYLENQEGQLILKDCYVYGNKRNGLWLVDSFGARLQSTHLQNCSVLESSHYGVLFDLSVGFRESVEDYDVTVANSTIASNALGGCWFYPSSCGWSFSRHRRVQLSFIGNKVEGNQKFGLNIYGPEFYELTAVLANNEIRNNSGYALKVAYYDSYCSDDYSFPVHVRILSSTFIKNLGEYTVLVDYNALPTKRYIEFNNNTFMENRVIKSFSSGYVRTKTQAVLAVNEGTITVANNSFVNPLFPHEMATMLKDHERVIQARNNWWGSKDECKVQERIFHFGDRIELAQIQYYPFLDSVYSNNATIHNSTRRSCFLQGNKLGGTLNQTVTLLKGSDTYQVVGDVIVLPNGILTIEENVTLEFPLKAVFIVFGKVVIKGTDSRRVKFIPKGPLRNGIRLVGSPDPWDGILEIWFNNTWLPVCLRRYRYESTIVCRQLGYEALSYSDHYSNGKETFLHNVQCDTPEIDSIVHCNRKNWMTSSSCSGYVAYIRCKTPYWTGVHLTITPKKSDIRNVDIDYAGFAYRDDLNIPGIALRVDLNKHNISGVFVNNSAGMGVQMMYPDPFKVSPDIRSSTITNTQGSGILLESPFGNLATTNVVNTKGYGFENFISWNPLNDHVYRIADMTVKMNIDLCSGNDTFIDDSSVVYYLVVRAKSFQACKKVITVPQDYSVGMQLIHHDLSSSKVFHVYSGTKTSLSTLWDVHNLRWRSRPVWETNSSSVLFESLHSYYYPQTAHFVLFLIKHTDKKKQWSTTGSLIISKSNFIGNDDGGVYLVGEDAEHIQIQSTVVQDSPDDGVTAEFLHVKNLNLFNCSFIGNQVGIRLSSFSGNVNIENTNFSNSTSYAIYLVSDGQKLVRFLNSSVIHSEGFGIYLKGNYEDASLFATNSFFGWNKATSVYSDIRYARGTPGRSHASFKNCTFLMNRGPVVNIDESPKYYPWEFEGNIFMNNTDNSVIMTTKYTDSRFSSGLFVRRNKFLFNIFQEKGVIYVKGGTKELIIDGNVFEENYGRSVFVEEQSFFHAPAVIQNNVFKDNSNSKGSVLEIRRMENDVIILNNVFKFNEGLNVILLHNECYVGAKRYMTFVNNSLLNNSNTWSSGCEVEISGMKEYKVFSMHHNRFNSQSFSKELCVNITANSHTSIVNVSLNYWGYDNENQIQERIYDAEDNYERALAVFIPFFGSTGELIQGSNQSDGLETFATRYLGGRISSSLHLWNKFSPYKVMSDVTVLPDAELTIHPGVELQFVSGVGMLILGALLVLGNRDNPVTFSLLKRNQTKISIPVRLVEGTFPWQGRLEVLHNGNWNPVCVNETIPFGKKNAKVICGQLGYRAPSTISYVVHLSSSERPLGAILNCNGNETEINECPLSLHNLSRNSTRQVALDCKGGTPWGNLRFLREFRNTSYPMTSKLQHLKIEHCGEKHGKKVAAIEMIQTIPEMVHVSILNCTTGGVKVLFPEREVYLRDLFLVNTGGYGGEMLITKRNFTLEKVTSMNNTHGLRFHELDGDWIDGVTYGQVFLCDPATNVTIMNRDLFLYVFLPLLRYLNLRLRCQLMVKTDEDAGFALQLLVMKNVGSITIENPRGQIILKFSSRDIVPLSRLIPWNGLTVYFEGWYSSEMLLQVQRMELKDMPCTFERSNCGWRQYPGKYFGNVLLDWQWRWYDDYHKPDGIPDHTYLYSGVTGNYMWFGHRWSYGYGAFSSPAIFKESDYCSLEFYYQFWGGGYRGWASLSVFIEQLTENSTTLLWSTSEITMYWKKKVVRLPQASYNYSVVFVGYFQNVASIVVDDIAFIRCNFSHEFTHRITESILSGNSEQGISYSSTRTKNHLLRIERCKITNNGGTSSGAIHLNAVNQAFELFNNHLAENRNGSIYSRVHYEETESRNVLNNHIHGNTFDSNRGVSLFLEGVTGPYFNVKVTNNYFSDNFAEDPDGKVNSVCRITNIRAHVQGNFFYNNIGRYAFEYSYAGENAIVLQFLNNTLYKNSALGLNVIYGVTILCNAAAEMHGNVIQNPGNRYQISTTWQGEQITVNATSNWWGESVANLIAPLIMDKTKDYRLTLTVSFKPFVQLPPQRVISVSCPPEWIKDNELCFLYKGSSFSFAEAKTYCQGYGGNIIAMFSDEDKRLVKDLRREESIISSSAPPSLWTMKRDFMRKSYEDNGVCSVLDSHGNITESQCDSLHPFFCVRRPVIHCPNGCFHNGDCIGAICFCYPGWTGEDCSRFHCHDLHNCSGNGKCMGPNACKCYPGYLGLGCTYSFCEKYESCSDCVTDPFCGWCDSSRSCLGGFAEGPPKESCPDWFYYNCYTVGDEGRCSSNIPIVDCRGKHCNFRNGRGTTESCQKCQDLDKCYKIAQVEGECRSWNETRCPGGQVMVDYTDPQRNENVELAENVKYVEPNTTLIYACPVIMAQHKHISLVFVAPKVLDVQAGDVLCSPQAGGIMHKITSEVTDGPFRVMMSVPGGFEEVIKYADFKKEATVEDVDDESTLEDEPDEEALEDIISGNITLNVSQIIVLPNAYKCLGHTYEIGNLLVHSYYLIVEKNITVPKKGDIVASNVSSGFIESVAAVHKSNDTGYLETKFQRCNENSQLNATRLKQSERRFSQSVFCSGGDNNQGLVLSAAEESAQHFAVNDSIVGRPSRGYIAKVVKVNSNGEFFLLEVISAKLNGNGTVSTAMDVNRLQSHHRRTRRSSKEIDLASFQSRISHKMLSTGNAKMQVSMSAYLSLTAFVEIESKLFGFGIKDATAGLKLEGGLDFSFDISVDGELRYTGDLLEMKDKQLGGTKYIRFGLIKLPVGIFLGMTGQATASISGSLRRSLSASGRVSLGGECSWSEGSCYTTDNSISLGSEWSKPKPELKTGAKIDVTVTPTISVKVPVMPKRFENGAKRPSLSILDKIVVAAADIVDLSLSLFASVPLKAGISMTYPSRQCRGKTPAEIEGFYGISDLIFGVRVGFLDKQLRLSFNTGFSLIKWTRDCICPTSSVKMCVGPPSQRPPPPRPPVKTPPKPPEKKQKKKKKTDDGSNQSKIPRLGCGEDYVCAKRRKGPNCTQPDMYPNQDCSKNGKPVITLFCGAECQCFGGWEGEYCERISANGGGDPHLETLDGVNFDFFGIGEFWGCKSVQNDFGLQFRFYYYERASLIGGVALKAGKSVVTVMTIKTDSAQDTPILRIDGMLINITSNSSKPIDINNGTVLLDRQRRFTFEAEENSVALISLQYDSGVTVTIDVRHSRVMKRQYLNVLYSPTAAYKGNTEGLCGFMDNNATNDFTGPDGILYKDAVQFAESWRIKACHNGSGRFDSWSWNSSNFNHEDTMDLTYTDPSYIPVYSLDGIPNSLLEVATTMCKSLNISNNDLHSCIFDVAITNDTTFTDQETFKRDCPAQCSGKGRCVNGTCRCIEGWTGESCDKGSCLNCSTAHGNCVKGFCVCDLGWEGRSCELKATCHNVSNCTSPVHGVCKTTDVCQCNPGYIGRDCSVIPTCFKVLNCTGNGLCVDFDVCKCKVGWTGTNCTQYSCEHLDYCSEHGRCVGLDECVCDYGWTGASCALPDCPAVNQCSGKGECVASNLCRCYTGFLGASCSEVADCSEFANCSGRGVCVLTEALNVSCSCYTGFTGANCSQPTCTTMNNCSNHGACIEAELCKCDMGYNGTDCSNFSCEAVNSCSGNGECVGYDVCRCNNSWSGRACSIPDCSSVNNCSAQGECILPDTCACYPAFDGEKCDQKAKPNTNAPSFDQMFYNATIVENSPVGTMILQVHANDTDMGRNGHVFYTVVSEKENGDSLAIGGTSGKLYSTSILDFETIKAPSFNVAVVASDDGFPQKSGVAVVQITVVDDNDNCPTFIEPSGKLQLEFSVLKQGNTLTKVSAVDLDSGINSDITYSMSKTAAFTIDPKSGVITATSNLTTGLYHLTVSASDNGGVSCKTETSLTVKINGVPTKEPLTSPASSSTHKVTETSPRDTQSTSMSTELTESTEWTEPTAQFTSTASGDEVTASPQNSPNYIIIGASAAGGVLLLVIIAVVIRKCLCKTRTSSAKEPRNIARVNDCLEGEFELSSITGNI